MTAPRDRVGEAWAAARNLGATESALPANMGETVTP